MSQESNTESNSDDKPKKRLSLKKSGGGSPQPAQPAPEKPKPQASSSSEKPFRMSFKKKEEEAAATPEASEAPAPAPEPATPPPPAPEPEPPADEAPPVKLGLKKTSEPEEAPPPPAAEAPAPPPVTPPVPKVKKIPIVEAGAPSPSEDLSKPAPEPAVPPPPSMKRAPEEKPRGSGPGTRPPMPPPGMKVRKDDDEVESAASAPPPPVSPLSSAPPPILPATDLMEEEIEAEKSHKTSPLKGIFVAAIILLFLVGGIGTIVWGVLGMLKDGEETVQEAPAPPPPPAAPAEPEPAPSGPQLATDEPKSFLGKTAKLTQQVSEKASTEEITDFAEGLEKEPAPEEPEAVKVSSEPAAGISRDVEPTPKAVRSSGDPEVRTWIEGIRPSGVGRGMMILDGEKYRLGEVVNPQLNVRWVGVDSQLGILIFEDPYGVRYEKDY